MRKLCTYVGFPHGNPHKKLWLTMKLTTLLILFNLAQLTASEVFSQNAKVCINVDRSSIEEVLNKIEKQTSYLFFYNKKLVSLDKQVSLNVTNKSVAEVLNQLFSGSNVGYSMVKDYIILAKKENKFLPVMASSVQKQKVTGIITDAMTGGPLPGASVVIDGTTTGVASNSEGKFTIEVPDENAVLVFSFMGYITQKIQVKNKDLIMVSLAPDVKTLNDVVVTAYGKKERKEAIVGSVTSIKPAELKIPASNLTSALAGQIAGLVSYQSSGQPGQDNATFFIRGVTTFGYNKSPLILIDNVELSASDLARLQVDDIASFSILKDASATALYGARGANGVILVSTKEGKAGDHPVINLRMENSISQSVKTLELADPITYMKLYNEATIMRDPLSQLPFTQNDIINRQATLQNAPGSNKYVYPAVDWLGMMFKKNAPTQRTDLSVSGGGAVARYYVTGSYSVDHGILNEDKANNTNTNVKFQNYQLRSNININLTKTTELVVRLSGNFNEYNGPLSADGSFSTDLYNLAMHTSPVAFPAFFPADSANRNTKHILFGNAGGDNNIKYSNPYAALLRGHKNYSESRMSAQLEFNQKLDFITEGLTFHGLFNTNRYSYFDSQNAYSPFYYSVGAYDKATNQYTLTWLNPNPTGANVATEYLQYQPGSTSINTFLYLQGAMEYSRKFGDHSLSGSLITTRQQTVYANAGTLLNSLPYRNLGLAGRATYSYKNRYFLEYNFGYNGSERFSANHRYGFFPTIGASWVVSNEKFWTDGLSKIVNRLKVRASYGLVGNDNIGSQRFFYLSDVNLNGGNFAYFGTNNGYFRNGVKINNYENSNVTWETSRQLNLGTELMLFNSLSLTAEVYKYHRYNILQSRSSIPSTEGLEAAISANIGAADSKGIDLSADYKKEFNRDVWISGRANFTYATSKYTQYEEPQYPEPWRHVVGQQINRTWGYVAERLFVDDKEAENSPSQIFSTNGTAPKGGDIKYRDLNSDGKIDGKDVTFLGYPSVPEIVYGYGLSTGYKSFDLSAFFQGQAHVSFFMDPSRVSPYIQSPDAYMNGNTQLLKAFADSHWSPENQDLYALYPRLGTTGAQIENNRQTSTWWMRSGSFLRLKSLEVGYTLPDKLTKRVHITKCRVYFNGLNLYTWSAFKLWDPELGGNGFAYPIQKVFNLGLNVTF
ncbi:MAG: TonB-dependent receptor [Bacteroidota bacterium]|nr:TonB-dependent receptor [Bacteroidota bacterium]